MTSIGDYAFEGCTGLTSITIPESVTYIGDHAFEGCTGELIVNCDIPDYAFRHSGFTKVVIGESVTSIGYDAFDGCTGELIVNCDIPDYAFRHSGFTKVVIGESVTSIGYDAFDGCSNLAEITIAEGNPVYDSRGGCNAIIETSSNTLLLGCSATIIPEGVTSVGYFAFRNCDNLTSITIPESVTSIGEYAFYNCSSLTSITIPERVTRIGDMAFYGCTGLAEITIAEGNPVYDSRGGCNAIIETSSNTLLLGCSATIIPASVTSIGDDAFRDCYNLTSITIPEGVTSIGEWAFCGCDNLTSITIPESVTSIGNCAFWRCNNLKTMVVKNDVPPTIESKTLGTEPLTVAVPWQSMEAYRNADYWNSHNFIPLYTVTYMVDGEVFKTDKFTSGSTLISQVQTREYTFIPDEMPETMPAEDIVINGTITANSYNLIYMVDGEVFKTESVPYGSALTLLAEPTKEGHTFGGWSELPETMPAEDVTISGSFTVNSYNLIYVVDGEVFKTVSVAYGSALTPLAESIKVGHTFISNEMPETMPAEDIVINGTFTANSYNLIYMVDGEVFKTESVVYGTEVAFTDDIPTKEGHTLHGWYTPIDIASNADAMLYSNAPYYGYASDDRFNGWHVLFDGDANTYFHSDYSGDDSADGLDHYLRVDMGEGNSIKDFTFTYIVRGNQSSYTPRKIVVEGSNEANDEYDEIAVLTNLPTSRGAVYESDALGNGNAYRYIRYRVEGQSFFYIAEFGMSRVGALGTMPAHDVVVNALFIKNKYKVTFKVGDEVISEELLDYGSRIYTPQVPGKEGHSFSWGEVDSYVPAHDVTYEGSYSINSYTLTYRVDGVEYKTEQVVYGSEIVLTDDVPTKEGYTFNGWDLGDVGTTMPARNVVANALFTINQYKVTFKVGDEVISEELLDYGSRIYAPQVPNKEGHSFSWGEVDSYVPAHDVTYEGSYSINSYTLTYVIEGEIVKELSVPYGTAIASLERPVKEGYTFSLIGEIPETMPAEDTTLNGTFTINKYRVTIALNGVVKKTGMFEYGSPIEVPTFAEKEGYTLTWSEEVPATVPAKDVYYNAVYVAKTYQVYYFVGANLVHTADVPYGEKIPEYIYEPKEGEGEFLGWIGDDYETMPAHEVYFTAELGETGTDIHQLLQDGGKLVIYNIQGRKIQVGGLHELTTGVYIINGKKVVIK